MSIKRISDSLLKLFDRILNVFFSLSAGLLTAQFPQFLAQYLQRLGGHIDEAQHIAEEFQLPALAERAATLTAGLDAINKASPFLRLPVFIANGQWEIARKAYENYTPGMTFTVEELCYLAGGALLGLFIYSGVKGVCRGIWLVLRKLAHNPGKKRTGKKTSDANGAAV